MNISDELYAFLPLFRERFLEAMELVGVKFDVVSHAQDYIDHNEHGLAFELLCTNIQEYGVPITDEEFQFLMTIADVYYDDAATRMAYLRNHIG